MSQILELRAVAQTALTTHITPRVRSISLELDSSFQKVRFRAYTDGALPQADLEALSCAVTEIQASLDYEVDEEYVVMPEPEPMKHLRIVVYVRCEDAWVDRT